MVSQKAEDGVGQGFSESGSALAGESGRNHQAHRLSETYGRRESPGDDSGEENMAGGSFFPTGPASYHNDFPEAS